ncbi:MAG: hypothetical protein AAF665_19400 [Pseudomonadota bacterium]
MDVEKIIAGAVRFSNFVTVRLMVFSLLGLFFVPAFRVKGIGIENLQAAFPVLEALLKNYKNTVTALGIDDVAIYLIFFVFITLIHITYALSERTGSWLPIDLVFESAESVERVFHHAAATALKDLGTDAKTTSALSAALYETHEAHENEWKKLLSFRKEIFNVSKFFLLVSLVALFFLPDDRKLSVLADNRVAIVLCTTLICILLGRGVVHGYRSAYSSLMYRLERILEKNLLGSLDTQSYSAVFQQTQDLRNRRITSYDWSLPLIGSVNQIRESIAKNEKQKQEGTK